MAGLSFRSRGAFDRGGSSIAPASVRRAERFIEENAVKSIGLADVASGAGVSAGRCKWAFAASVTRREWRICGRCGWGWRAANGPSLAGRRFGHFGRERTWFRVSQPIRRRVQSPLPRVAFRNATARRPQLLISPECGRPAEWAVAAVDPASRPETIAQHLPRKRSVAEFALSVRLSRKASASDKPPSSFGSGNVTGSKGAALACMVSQTRHSGPRISDRLREGHELTLWEVHPRAELRLVGGAAKDRGEPLGRAKQINVLSDKTGVC